MNIMNLLHEQSTFQGRRKALGHMNKLISDLLEVKGVDHGDIIYSIAAAYHAMLNAQKLSRSWFEPLEFVDKIVRQDNEQMIYKDKTINVTKSLIKHELLKGE